MGSQSLDLASLALSLELDGEKCDHCLMSIVHFLSVVSFHRLCSSEPFYFYLPKYCTWLFAVFSKPNVSFFVCF